MAKKGRNDKHDIWDEFTGGEREDEKMLALGEAAFGNDFSSYKHDLLSNFFVKRDFDLVQN